MNERRKKERESLKNGFPLLSDVVELSLPGFLLSTQSAGELASRRQRKRTQRLAMSRSRRRHPFEVIPL
jgi:hypothetical protein